MNEFRSLPDARDALKSADSSRRLKAIDYLVDHDYPERALDLVACLDDVDDAIVEAAIRGLTDQPGDWPTAGIVTALESRSIQVRRMAALALGGHGDRRALPALLDALHDADWQLRLAAVYSLAQLGGPQALIALNERLKDTQREVRFAAAHLLDRIELRSAAHGR